MPNLPGDRVLAEVEDKGEVNETRGLTAGATPPGERRRSARTRTRTRTLTRRMELNSLPSWR